MQAGLPRGAGAPTGPLLLLGSGLLAALALFAGDGSSYSPLVGIGGLALVIAGAGLALAFWGVIPLPRLAGPAFGFGVCFAALVGWIGLSVMWSVAPDLSWEYANRALVYLAFLSIGLVIGAWRPPLRWVAAGAGLLSAAVVGWALAGKIIPDLFPDGGRLARLRDPLGYWNALAVVAGFAILNGIWATSRPEHRPWVRVAGAVAVFASTIALLLTYSRGGVVVAAIVVAGFIALVRERIQVLAALLVAVPPALAISLWAFTSDGIAANGQSYDARLEAGLVLGALLLVGGALVGVGARYLLRHEVTYAERIWRPTTRQTAAAFAAVAAVAVVVAVAGGWAGQALDDFRNPPSAQGPGRLGSVSSSRRWEWWQESWEIFQRDPVQGSGAGSFFIARRPYRTDLIIVVEPHSLPIQFLGETGIVGLALLLGLIGTGAAAVVQTVRGLEGAERAAGTALALAALAYVLHTFVDYDWDFVALTGPVLLAVGLLLATGAPVLVQRRRPLLAAGAALLAAASIASVAAPWLADREVTEAFAAIDREDPGAAREAADRARSLNPLAIEPFFAAALAEEQRGRQQEALRLYVRAVELQPENSQTWYQLARYEHTLGLSDAAIRHAGQAQALDPKNEAIVHLIQELFAPPDE
jgi:Flp pilus assembly protein TadD